MMEANRSFSDFQRAVASINKGLIILIAQVDPDALGSAHALAWLIRTLRPELPVEIYYGGIIGHPQNRFIFNRFNLGSHMQPIAQLTDSKGYDFALVDSSKTTDGRLGKFTLPRPKIIFDHHRTDALMVATDADFYQIEDAGSSCTLIIELLQAGSIQEIENAVRVLLALGVYTDTQSLVSAGQRDHEAHSYITRGVATGQLIEIIRFAFPDSYFRNLSTALNGMERQGARLATCVGKITVDNADDLSTIAEYLSRMEGVTLVAVWGWIESKVRLSVRTRDPSIQLEVFLKRRFPKSSGAKLTPDGRGEGGALIDLSDVGLVIPAGEADKIMACYDAAIAKSILTDEI